MSQDARQAALRDLLGADGLLTDAEAMAPYLVDHRRLYHGRALGIAMPRDVAGVSRLLAWCNAERIGVVPQGGNTGYCGGATPDESGTQLVLSLARLNRIRRIDAADFSLVAEAGCTLAAVQAAAAAAGRFFPLRLGSEGTCQIGGNLATNAGGLNVVRYGMTRELVLGIEAVFADGTVLPGLSALRKDNTGYHLPGLLVGSEGTLAIITAASLKLWPSLRTHATAMLGIEGPEQALTLLGELRAHAADRLSSFELLPRIAIELVCRHIPGARDPFGAPHAWYVLCEISSSAEEALGAQLETELARALDRGLVRDAVVAQNERERQALWHLRESVPEAQRRAGASIKHDIAVPVGSLPRFIREASALVGRLAGGTLVCYGHAGDGNVHFNLSALTTTAAALQAEEPTIKRAIHDLVLSFDGSISAEHGIGRLKRDELARYAPAAKMAALRAIKQALDPHGILNPGKLL